ncbi:hypothetical protein T07_2436 [Trichinella nelsoni]|uniref:Uncharacterized protein n=1 Tax=Trichinella nelsoni TaxID=6336 RepID=A0A0V0S9V9_9BILA|nr:hypothetical protein T07_2436 [Trichinella nelsoni]
MVEFSLMPCFAMPWCSRSACSLDYREEHGPRQRVESALRCYNMKGYEQINNGSIDNLYSICMNSKVPFFGNPLRFLSRKFVVYPE